MTSVLSSDLDRRLLSFDKGDRRGEFRRRHPKIINAYFLIDRPDKVIMILSQYLQTHTNDYSMYPYLAKAYFMTGDINSSIKSLLDWQSTTPDVKRDVNNTIKLLQDPGSTESDVLESLNQLIT